jgi:hypothetical protein
MKMGQINRFKDKVVIRFSVDEILMVRVAASKNVTFTLAEMIRKFAEMKASEKDVQLSPGRVSIEFDPGKSEFIITFLQEIENVMR